MKLHITQLEVGLNEVLRCRLERIMLTTGRFLPIQQAVALETDGNTFDIAGIAPHCFGSRKNNPAGYRCCRVGHS